MRTVVRLCVNAYEHEDDWTEDRTNRTPCTRMAFHLNNNKKKNHKTETNFLVFSLFNNCLTSYLINFQSYLF